MLRIDLGDLLRTPGMEIAINIDETPPSDEDLSYAAPVRGLLTLTNAGELVLVRGSLKTTLLMECGRCLAEARVAIDAPVEEQYTLQDTETAFHDVTPTIISDEENEVPPGLLTGTVMDLNVIIQQAVILNRPLRPLCKDDCLGLCPICGTNRNETPCTCGNTARNTPFAQLKKLYEGDTP